MTITPDISVAIAFVIFVVLVAWKGTKKLTAGLDQRADAIRKQLDETQNLREEAQAALASYQRQQRDALRGRHNRHPRSTALYIFVSFCCSFSVVTP